MGMETEMSNDLYRDRDSRLDTIVGDNKAYFAMLGRIMFTSESTDMVFQDWCETQHGFRPIYDENGAITGKPEITDPQKYTLCVLKYGG
jgi:hypothetical protein